MAESSRQGCGIWTEMWVGTVQDEVSVTGLQGLDYDTAVRLPLRRRAEGSSVERDPEGAQWKLGDRLKQERHGGSQ